jgi:hypothetical protein
MVSTVHTALENHLLVRRATSFKARGTNWNTGPLIHLFDRSLLIPLAARSLWSRRADGCHRSLLRLRLMNPTRDDDGATTRTSAGAARVHRRRLHHRHPCLHRLHQTVRLGSVSVPRVSVCRSTSVACKRRHAMGVVFRSKSAAAAVPPARRVVLRPASAFAPICRMTHSTAASASGSVRPTTTASAETAYRKGRPSSLGDLTHTGSEVSAPLTPA